MAVKKSANRSLRAAAGSKKDEFHTRAEVDEAVHNERFEAIAAGDSDGAAG
jgi:hypothetical protein